jgi:PAS domain S-box-containing protein
MVQTSSVGQGKFSLPPWLPVAASLVLMVMVAFVAALNAKSLKNVTQWRRHSTQVILAGQAFENNLLEMQHEMRSYITLGDTNALVSFDNNEALASRQFTNLVILAIDNPDQQQRLSAVATAMGALLAIDNHEISIYQQKGPKGITEFDANRRRAAFNPVENALSAFLTNEQSLWDTRDASEQKQYHYAGHLLVIGSILAAMLLLLATFMASRELAFRRHAEARLREAMVVQNAILGSADYGIVATDREGTVQSFNPAAERLLGYSADEVIGQATPMLWRDPREITERAEKLSKKLGVPVKANFDAIAKKVQYDMVDEGEWTFIRKDSSRFPCLIVVTPLANEAGQTVGYLGIFGTSASARNPKWSGRNSSNN